MKLLVENSVVLNVHFLLFIPVQVIKVDIKEKNIIGSKKIKRINIVVSKVKV